MGMLKNQRHELFAQGLAAGKTADEAYKEAGYKPDRGNASRLTAVDSIRARVAELQARAPKGIVITKQWVLERLFENASRAMQAEASKFDEDGNPIEYSYQGNVANRSLELIGKELGMFVDRKEVGAPGDFDKLNAAELRELIRSEATELGVSLPALEALGGDGAARGKPH